MKVNTSVQEEPSKRRRRKGDATRADLTAAAQQLFAERGYARTTTKDIALRAQSSEVLLFRYFQSKANLFREAVVDPFDNILKDFLAEQTRYVGDEPFAGSQEFVHRLFDVVSAHKNVLLALVSTRLYETGAPEELVTAGGFKEYFNVAVDRIETELGQMGVEPAIAPHISSRISFIAVVATALFRDWIFTDVNIDPERVIVALNQFIISGMGGYPQSAGKAGSSVTKR